MPQTAIETSPSVVAAEQVSARGVSPRGLSRRRPSSSRRSSSASSPAPWRSGPARRCTPSSRGSALPTRARSIATEESILWDLRVPRVVLAALVGGMLALAGATYQGVFHNPLADPYLLGVAAGAGLGATLAISYLPRALAGQQVLPIAAFVGGAAAVVVTWAIGRRSGRERDATTFVLAGRRRRELLHRRADLRAAAELGHAAGGLLVDPGRAPELRLERRPRARAVRRRRERRDPRLPPRARRAEPRGQRGREPGHRRRSRPARCSSSPRPSVPLRLSRSAA